MILNDVREMSNVIIKSRRIALLGHSTCSEKLTLAILFHRSMLSKVGAILKRQLSEGEATRILKDLKVDALDAQKRGPSDSSSSKTCITHEASSGSDKRFDQVCVSMDWLMNITVMLAGGTRPGEGSETLGYLL